MLYHWNNFLIEGDELFNYMVNNFENMFDENIIKHFDIKDGLYRNIENTYTILETYNNYIQKELIEWIKNELYNKRLFNKSLWKPFRNQNDITDMYYGYRKLFKYKHYYFQLALETYCKLDECIYCNHNKDEYYEEYNDNSQHFILTLYGWKNNISNKLQPYEKVLIPYNDIMCDIHWNYQ